MTGSASICRANNNIPNTSQMMMMIKCVAKGFDRMKIFGRDSKVKFISHLGRWKMMHNNPAQLIR